MTEPNRGVFATASEGRLDVILGEQFPNISRNQIQKLIKAGHAAVDGVVVLKPGHSLRRGEKVKFTLPEPRGSELVAENIPLEILFEDSDVLVVNKPAGMVVHPSPGHSQGTLVHAALAHIPDLQSVGGELRPGIVHRLDKGTSGVIILAKNDRSYAYLQDQFRARTVKKKYLALVDGRPPSENGRIEADLSRDAKKRKKISIVPTGKGREAITSYQVVETYEDYSLLEVSPKTGRTHQIRVHLAFLKTPIVGDAQYGSRSNRFDLTRPFLHAWELTLNLPGSDEAATFQAPLAPELQEIIDRLGSIEIGVKDDGQKE